MSRKILTEEMKKYVVKIFQEQIDLTNQQKADLINYRFDTTFGESAFRKYFKSYVEGLQDGIDNTATEKQLETLAKKELKIKLERKKNEIQRYTLNKQVNESAAFIEIEKILKDKLSKIKPQKLTLKHNTGKTEEIFFVGDEQTRGYEEEIQQLRETFNQVRKHSKSKHVTIGFTGDGWEGMHRASTLLSIKKTTVHQVIDYMTILIEGVLGLYEEGYTIDLKMVTSNHTNLRPQGKNEFPGNDMVYVMGWTMRQLTKHLEGITVEVKDILPFTHNGKTYVMLHGHQGFAKNKKSLENAIFRMFGYLPDFIIVGHFHQFKVTKEGKYTLIVVPTAKLSTEHYERNAGYIHEPAILKLTTYKDSQDFETRIIHFGEKMGITDMEVK